ncbi:MAG TPA: hypothetical protein VK619_07040 [Pyrinomonadaceae bacterium]|nr:hypothetical protein [Pyrinomonadaceae bacterium]
MKALITNFKGATGTRLALAAIIFCALVAAPFMSRAQSQTATISVSNDSSRVIRHVYLSSPSDDNWSADQLTGALGTGGSVTLSGVGCYDSGVKVIAEDADGCFVSTVVGCGNASWSITNDITPDCGGN